MIGNRISKGEEDVSSDKEYSNFLKHFIGSSTHNIEEKYTTKKSDSLNIKLITYNKEDNSKLRQELIIPNKINEVLGKTNKRGLRKRVYLVNRGKQKVKDLKTITNDKILDLLSIFTRIE